MGFIQMLLIRKKNGENSVASQNHIIRYYNFPTFYILYLFLLQYSLIFDPLSESGTYDYNTV